MATVEITRIVVDLNGSEQTFENVRVTIGDVNKYDVVRNRYGLPGEKESPSTFTCGVAWASLIRTRRIDNNTSPEDFVFGVTDIEVPEPEEEDDSKSVGAE